MRRLPACLLCLFFMQSLPAQEEPRKLNLLVVEGEGAINNIRQRTAREPIVEVQDENRRPVAGAVVVFTIIGRNGAFPNSSKTLTVLTDEKGRAVARGIQAQARGRIDLRIDASSRGQTASTTISRFLSIGEPIAIMTVLASAAEGRKGTTADHQPVQHVATKGERVTGEITTGGDYDSAMQIKTGSHLTVNGKQLQVAGAPTWPLASGDQISTGDFSAVLSFADGAQLSLAQNTKMAVKKCDRCVAFLFQGTINYRMTAESKIEICARGRAVRPAQGSEGSVSVENPSRVVVRAGGKEEVASAEKCSCQKSDKVPFLWIAGGGAAAAAGTVAIVTTSSK